MLMSQDRILTTHTGSLPRPAALTELYVRRSRNETIDPAELDTLGKAAVQEVVAKQIAAGIDVGNNGEQQREAFFLYVRHRMSGFGGGWTRKVFADVTHYPAFGAWKAAHDAVNQSISNTGGIPEAIGEVRYLDRALVEAECQRFPCRARYGERQLRRTVHDSPLARHHRRGDAQRVVRHGGRLPRRARPRAAGGIRDDRRARLPVADRRPGPRDGTPSLLPGSPAQRLHRFRRTRGGDNQHRARQHTARPGAPACLLGQLRGPARLRRGPARDPAGDPPREGRRLRAAVRQSSPRPRVSLPEGPAPRRRPGHCRRRHRPADQLRRAPRGSCRPHRAGRASGR